MTAVILWTPFERLLFSLYIFLNISGGTKYALNAKNTKNRDEKNLLLGFAALGIFNGIAQVLYFISQFYHKGVFIEGLFIGNPDDSLSPSHEWIFIGHIFFCLMFFLFTIQFERVFNQTRKILSTIIVFSSLGALITFWNAPINWNAFYLFMLLVMLLFYISIIKLLLNSNIEMQNLSFFILAGFALSMLATIFVQPSVVETGLIPPEIKATIQVISVVLIIVPAFIDIEKIIKTNPSLIFIVFFLSIFSALIFTIYGVIVIGSAQIIGVIMCSIFIIMGVIRYRNSKSASVNKTIEHKGILQAFSRPQKLTEDEVSISKEKKICLVCKGRVLGITLICRECEAFYCEKCFRALSDLENACWACDTALDESKPLKIAKKEEEKEVEIEAEPHKKGK